MPDVKIYHNPRCSKSRETLARLERLGAKPTIIEYLDTPPTATELEELIRMLGIDAAGLVRRGEQIYRQRYAGRTLTEAQWIDAMVRDPVLIERPIVVAGSRAVIGRPPENVDALLRA